jgi:hypothetical protein
MEKPLTNRRLLTILTSLTSVLALACLLVGLTAGHEILQSIGLAKFAAMLEAIPAVSAVVTCFGALVTFAIGVGLCMKGMSETLMKSSVPGAVRSTTVRELDGDGSSEFVLESRVAYCVDGVSYEREGRHSASSNTAAQARERLAGIHPGDPVRVFYKPGDPGTIELDAPPRRTLVVLAVGAWIIFLSLGVMFLNGVVFRLGSG